MLNQQTLDKLHTLKLTDMAEAFTDQLKRNVSVSSWTANGHGRKITGWSGA